MPEENPKDLQKRLTPGCCQPSAVCGRQDEACKGCAYSGTDEPEELPPISKMAQLFPNEWLAFIVPPAADDDGRPEHGKLIAHSPQPDEVFDAQQAVLWSRCVYVFFNGDFNHLQASFGPEVPDLSRRPI